MSKKYPRLVIYRGAPCAFCKENEDCLYVATENLWHGKPEGALGNYLGIRHLLFGQIPLTIRPINFKEKKTSKKP